MRKSVEQSSESTKKQLTRKRTLAQRKLCCELPLIVHRLDECGLHATARLVQKAVERIGWEITGHPLGQPTPAEHARACKKANKKLGSEFELALFQK